MQTFLPYPDFARSAAVLDRQRLGKQRVECKQILLALTDPSYGWQNHPAVKMWRGWDAHLARYGMAVCTEWVRRGYRDTLFDFFDKRHVYSTNENLRDMYEVPPHLADPAFNASHRSNLLRKDPVWYGKYGWTEPADLPYVWPTCRF